MSNIAEGPVFFKNVSACSLKQLDVLMNTPKRFSFDFYPVQRWKS